MRLLFALFLIIVGAASSLTAQHTNCYVRIADQKALNIENAIDMIELMGGRVNHIMRPNEFLCTISEQGAKALMNYDELEIETVGNSPKRGDSSTMAYRAWSHLVAQTEEADASNHGPKLLDSTFPCGLEIFELPKGAFDDSANPKTDPAIMVTNNFMVGRIAVCIALMESEGHSEDWTETEEWNALYESIETFEWLSERAASRKVKLTWDYVFAPDVPCSEEPILTYRPDIDYFPTYHFHFGWIDEALENFGVDPEWDGLFELANNLRSAANADWAFTLFIVKNDNRSTFQHESNKFSGYTKYYHDYLWGQGGEEIRPPFVVATYKYIGNYENSDWVFAHEILHIFGGMDETAMAGGQCSGLLSCWVPGGYLRYPNLNCSYCGSEECIMKTPFVRNFCPITLGHIGWVDSDSDGAPDPIDPGSCAGTFIPGVALGDNVCIYSIDGDFLNSISCTENTTIGNKVLWNGRNLYNQDCAHGIYLASINNGTPFSIVLSSVDPSRRPVIGNMTFQNDSIIWDMDSSWSYVTCSIFDKNNVLRGRPMWNKMLDTGYKAVDVSSIGCQNCRAEVYGWRPDGGLSNTGTFHYDRVCVGGKSSFTGLDMTGPYSWARKIIALGDNSLILLSVADEEGLIVSKLRRFKSDGCIAWTRTYSDPDEDFFLLGMLRRSNGDLVLTGYKSSHMILMNTDSIGNIIWTKSIGDGVNSIVGEDIIEVHGFMQNYYMIAGALESGKGFWEMMYMKTDESGNVVWIDNLGDGINQSYAYSISYSAVSDMITGFYIAGEIHEPDNSASTDIRVIKASHDRSIGWVRTWGDLWDVERNPHIMQLGASDFAVVNGDVIEGVTQITKIDTGGNTIWSREYSGMGISEAFTGIRTSDAGIVAAGSTGGAGLDLFFMKVDGGDGDIVWQSYYNGGSGDERVLTLGQMNNSGFVMAGESADHNFLMYIDPPPAFICGDVNADQSVDALDVTYLINYLFKGGPAPNPLESADTNNDGHVNALDVTMLINYLYKHGSPPICWP